MTTCTAPSAADVAAAAARISPYVRRTPILRAEVDGRPLVLKLEHLQRTGSFKPRGAFNALLSGPLPKRVVTVSGGNHGLAVATASRQLGIPATVYVPDNVPEIKARRIEEAGARLVRCGTVQQAFAEGERVAAEDPDAYYLKPYDDAPVVAGQGTATLEAVTDAPDVDAVVAAVGGGGLAGGAVLASGGRTVVAVEPELCRCLHDALDAGEPVDSPVESVAASSLGAGRIGDIPFELLRSDSVAKALVTDTELLAARDRMWEEFRLAVEPGAAVAFAAWLAGRVPGELACLIVCGANAEWIPA